MICLCNIEPVQIDSLYIGYCYTQLCVYMDFAYTKIVWTQRQRSCQRFCIWFVWKRNYKYFYYQSRLFEFIFYFIPTSADCPCSSRPEYFLLDLDFWTSGARKFGLLDFWTLDLVLAGWGIFYWTWTLDLRIWTLSKFWGPKSKSNKKSLSRPRQGPKSKSPKVQISGLRRSKSPSPIKNPRAWTSVGNRQTLE